MCSYYELLTIDYSPLTNRLQNVQECDATIA